ncbi:hypothetical protein SLEP1_g60181, partial [Rubroshorea leprosula]
FILIKTFSGSHLTGIVSEIVAQARWKQS